MLEIVKPQQCTAARTVEEALKGRSPEDFVQEIKYDGFRIIAYIGDAECTLLSRTGKSQAGRLPHVEKFLLENVPPGTVIDGEIVALKTNKSDFALVDQNFSYVQSVMLSKPERSVRVQQENDWFLNYVVFDMMRIAHDDIRKVEWYKRRDYLKSYIPILDEPVMISDASDSVSQTIHDNLVDRGYEGTVLKKKSSKYTSGRSRNWYKLKKDPDVDVVITGFTGGEGKYSDTIGAVQFSQFGVGKELIERGQCSGMTDELRRHMGSHEDDYLGRVMTIRHNGVMEDGIKFRHPRFIRLRPDKNAEDCDWHDK